MQASQYLEANADGSYQSYVKMSWTDPMNDMINATWEIAFRTSITAVSNTSLAGSIQNVPYKGNATHIVYVTNYRYLFIAAAISFLGVLAVIPIF